MKKQKIKWLSILLVVIMVITTIPQNGVSILANAQEADLVEIDLEEAATEYGEWDSLAEVGIVEETDAESDVEEVSTETAETEIMQEETSAESEITDVEIEKIETEDAEGENVEDETVGESEGDITENETETEDTPTENEIEFEESETVEETKAVDDATNIEKLSKTCPTVMVKESYDTFLSLTLGVPKDAVLPDKGDLYYVVSLTIHKSDEAEDITQDYFFKKEESSCQDITIELNNGLIAEGQEWTYDISVSLVCTMISDTISVEEITGTSIGVSNVRTLDDVEVTPYYESKLTLKEGTKKIYTTQQDVAIATVKFSKKTTERDNLLVEDVTYATDMQHALELREIGEDLVLYASADADTALGKHKIKVTASAPEYMYASEAFITVNVVQGIEERMLSLVTPSDELYKDEKKAATLTFRVQYSKDSNTLKNPERKKVTWELLTPDGNAITEEDALYGMISIKNGVVTVKKKYVVSENPQDNRFMVKATAADYKGNTVSVCSEIVEIVAQAEELGEVVIVKENESGDFIVTGRSETTITSNQLGYVRVLKIDAPLQDSYTAAEMEQWILKPQYLTYKSNNSAVKIEKDGFITVTKPVKNIKITATANDKSKHKAELRKLTVAYAQPEAIGLRVELIAQDGGSQPVGDISAESTDINVLSNADSRYRITVMQKNGENDEWEKVSSYVNFKLTLQNGKVLKKSGDAKQFYHVSTTKEKMTLKLTDKAKKETITYNIINTTFPKGKKPKVSTKDKLKALGYDKEQTVLYTIKKNGTFLYDFTGKTVLITVDNAEKYKSDTSEARYNAFEQVVNGLGYQSVDGGTFSLDFVTSSDTPLPAGNYKLWFTFGTLDESGEFLADTAAMAVTLKANKVQVEKGTYTPTTSYKMAMKEGGMVDLTGKGKRFLEESVVFSNLRNANVNGGPNAFLTYYELTDDNKLKLKDKLEQEQLDYITSAAAKNDWACHVDYSVLVSNTDGSYSEKTGTVKIKITMLDSVRKFTFNTVNATDSKKVVTVNAYANSKKENIIHAYATAGSYTATCDGTSKIVLTPKTGNAKPRGGENKVTIYVVPEGTYQANEEWLDKLEEAWKKAESEEGADSAEVVDKAAAEAAYVTAIKKCGIKATAKVVLPSVENRELSEQVVKLVNEERAKIGLKPLSINEDVMYAAFVRAKETSTYFSHTRPDGRSCFTVLGEYGVSYRTAGENIAYGYPTPEAVMESWMNSSGHRANILYSSFTEIGVGCYEYDGRLYWVQLFIG